MHFGNLILAFIEGFALIISPCILPILPFVLAVGVSGGKLRPYGITIGFIFAFCTFTLLSRQLIEIAHISADVLRLISYYILLIFGIILMSNYLSNQFHRLTQSFANLGKHLSDKNQGQGFFGGVLLGLPIGLVWTPCGGPIIAAILVEIILAKTSVQTVLILLAFSIGACIPMLLLTLLGNRMLTHINFFKRHGELLRKLLGLIIILTVIFTAQFSLLTKPAFAQTNNMSLLQDPLSDPYPAPEITGVSTWINSQPLNLKHLRGKVVLINFWSYSCTNCIREIPYLNDWYQKYHQQGFVIIGIHSPQYAFEQNINNVRDAVAQYNIVYPVAVDNGLTNWLTYNNYYWPSNYLLDKNGNVVYVHFGDGDNSTIENNIRALLG